MVWFYNYENYICKCAGCYRKEKDFTSMPYSKIQLFSVETAGTFDRDAELELWFSGAGKVKFELPPVQILRQLPE